MYQQNMAPIKMCAFALQTVENLTAKCVRQISPSACGKVVSALYGRRQSVASAAACRMSRSLCLLSVGRRANIRAASLAGRPNQTVEAGLIGLTYSIKPSIKLALTIH